jgi:transcriptional regulator with XRE-family HTH domain
MRMLSASNRKRHFLRAWRKHRGYTLEQVAERLHMSHQNLGKIERCKVPWNQDLLERLAEEYRCDVTDLINRDPTDPESLWSIWDQLAPTERIQLVEVAKVLKRTGTES